MMQVKQEITTLLSRTPDSLLLYPGPHVVTWVKVPHLPWMLHSISPLEPTSGEKGQ